MGLQRFGLSGFGVARTLARIAVIKGYTAYPMLQRLGLGLTIPLLPPNKENLPKIANVHTGKVYGLGVPKL